LLHASICDAIPATVAFAFPRDKGAGLTVLLDALPLDARIVLVEPKADLGQVEGLRSPPRQRPTFTPGKS
jgi:hypothetical protein